MKQHNIPAPKPSGASPKASPPPAIAKLETIYGNPLYVLGINVEAISGMFKENQRQMHQFVKTQADVARTFFHPDRFEGSLAQLQARDGANNPEVSAKKRNELTEKSAQVNVAAKQVASFDGFVTALNDYLKLSQSRQVLIATLERLHHSRQMATTTGAAVLNILTQSATADPASNLLGPRRQEFSFGLEHTFRRISPDDTLRLLTAGSLQPSTQLAASCPSHLKQWLRKNISQRGFTVGADGLLTEYTQEGVGAVGRFTGRKLFGLVSLAKFGDGSDTLIQAVESILNNTYGGDVIKVAEWAGFYAKLCRLEIVRIDEKQKLIWMVDPARIPLEKALALYPLISPTLIPPDNFPHIVVSYSQSNADVTVSHPSENGGKPIVIDAGTRAFIGLEGVVRKIWPEPAKAMVPIKAVASAGAGKKKNR